MKTQVLFVMLFAIAAAGQSQPSKNSFAVQLLESQDTLRPAAGPIRIQNCAVVFPDGQLLLELIRAESFGGKTTIVTYESRLSQEQMRILRGLLDAADVKALAPVVPPNTPMAADFIDYFEARIARESDLQRVGFLVWSGEGPTNPEPDKKGWEDAKVRLQPLVEWLHALKSSKEPPRRRIANKTGACGNLLNNSAAAR